MSQPASEKEIVEVEEMEDVSAELKMPPADDTAVDAVSKPEKKGKTKDRTFPPLDALAKLEAELKDAQSKYLYAIAETDNIKKRNLRERTELIKYQGESLARDLLEILDDLDRVSAVGPEAKAETILEGVQLITSRMRSIFERYDIKAQQAVGSKFDPAKHEALAMVNSEEVESGVIIQELKRSYYYKDKLLRPAQVVVSNGAKVLEEDSI